jgi:hypothetical protein
MLTTAVHFGKVRDFEKGNRAVPADRDALAVGLNARVGSSDLDVRGALLRGDALIRKSPCQPVKIPAAVE